MKERFEEARLVVTITVGIVTAEVYVLRGLTASSSLGTMLKFSSGVT